MAAPAVSTACDEGWCLVVTNVVDAPDAALSRTGGELQCRFEHVSTSLTPMVGLPDDDPVSMTGSVFAECWPIPTALILPGARFGVAQRPRYDTTRMGYVIDDGVPIADLSPPVYRILQCMLEKEPTIRALLLRVCNTLGEDAVGLIDRIATRATRPTPQEQQLVPPAEHRFVRDVYASISAKVATLASVDMPVEIVGRLTAAQLTDAIHENPFGLMRLTNMAAGQQHPLHPHQILCLVDRLTQRLGRFRPLGDMRLQAHAKSALSTCIYGRPHTWVSAAALERRMRQTLTALPVPPNATAAEPVDSEAAGHTLGEFMRMNPLERAPLFAAADDAFPWMFTTGRLMTQERALARRVREFVKQNQSSELTSVGKVWSRATRSGFGPAALIGTARRLRANHPQHWQALDSALTTPISVLVAPATSRADLIVTTMSLCCNYAESGFIIVCPSTASAASLAAITNKLSPKLLSDFTDPRENPRWRKAPFVIWDAHLVTMGDLNQLLTLTNACAGRATNLILIGDPHALSSAQHAAGAVFRDLSASGCVQAHHLPVSQHANRVFTPALLGALERLVGGAQQPLRPVDGAVFLAEMQDLASAVDAIATRHAVMLNAAQDFVVAACGAVTRRALINAGITRVVHISELRVLGNDTVILLLDRLTSCECVYTATSAARKKLAIVSVSAEHRLAHVLARPRAVVLTNLAYELQVAFKKRQLETHTMPHGAMAVRRMMDQRLNAALPSESSAAASAGPSSGVDDDYAASLWAAASDVR